MTPGETLNVVVGGVGGTNSGIGGGGGGSFVYRTADAAGLLIASAGGGGGSQGSGGIAGSATTTAANGQASGGGPGLVYNCAPIPGASGCQDSSNNVSSATGGSGVVGISSTGNVTTDCATNVFGRRYPGVPFQCTP